MLALRERGVFVKQEKKKIVIWIKKKLLFREKASFTVEASLIMMTVLMAVFMCIYYGFQPGMTCALTGSKNVDQAVMNAAAGDWDLTAEELKKIDDAYDRIFRA